MQSNYTTFDCNGPSREEWEWAIQWLHAYGAHFVLAGMDKKPRWRRWNERRPTVRQILNHKGPVGVIPATVGATVLDADQIPGPTNLRELLNRLAHMAVLRSQRADRAHIFMRDDTSRTNGRFSAFGITGDIRSGSGYVILWRDAAPRLVGALIQDEGSPGSLLQIPQFEEWAISRGASARRRKGPRREKTRLNSKPNPHLMTAGSQPDRTKLKQVRKGNRNESLFLTLRLWAYGRQRGNCWTDWQGMVRQCARSLNAEFEEPLPATEVTRTADSVAEFCWDQLDEVVPREEGPGRENQARRGRISGYRRRQASGHLAKDAKPWLRLGLSRSRYYEIRKKFRDENGGREPTDREFARQTPEQAREQRRRAGKISADRRRKPRPPEEKPTRSRHEPLGMSKRDAGYLGGQASGYARRARRCDEHRTPWKRDGVGRTQWYEIRRRTEAERNGRVRAGRNLNHGGRGHGGAGGDAGARRRGTRKSEPSDTRARNQTETMISTMRCCPAGKGMSRSRRARPTPAEQRRQDVADLITELHERTGPQRPRERK